MSEKIDQAHQALKHLFQGKDAPYGHPSKVEQKFMEWLRNQNGYTGYIELTQDMVRGFAAMPERTAERVLNFIKDEHPEVVE